MSRPGNGSPPVPQFQTAQQYADFMAAQNAGPTGMYEKDTIQSGPHKGKTPNQVTAYYLAQGAAQGLPMSGGSTAGQPSSTREQNIAAAKADGTYDAKMAAYNAANAATGHTMDASGNIKREGSWVSGSQKGSQIFIPKIAATTAPGPDTPVNNSQPPSTAQPSTSPSPPTFTRNLAAEEKNRSAGGFTSAAPGSRNLVAEEQQRQGPGLGQRLQSRIASGNLPAPTPPKLGPAAQALADFNKANPNVMTGAAGVAQTDALAQQRRGTLAEGQRLSQPSPGSFTTTTTPVGVPAPAPTFTGAQTDRYNTAMASVSGSKAPTLSPAAAPSPTAPTPAPIAAAPQAPPTAAPGFIQKRVNANPGGIFAKGQEVAGKVQAGIQSAAQTITPPAIGAAKAVGGAIVNSVNKVAGAVQQFGRQKAAQGDGMFRKILGNPTPPKIAGKRAEGGPVTAGQPYLVGEKGPEVIVPQSSGTVIPNKALHAEHGQGMASPRSFASSNLGMPAGTPSRPSRPLSTTRNWRMPTSPRTTATWKPQPPRLLAIN